MESGEMNTEILGVALQIVLLIVISYPLGKYIANKSNLSKIVYIMI